jgi:hypothetical protein
VRKKEEIINLIQITEALLVSHPVPEMIQQV